MTAMMTVVEAGTAEVAEDTAGAMMTTIAGLATMIVTLALLATGAVTITALAVSIAMHLAVAKTATAAGMITVVRETILLAIAGAATETCLRGMLTAEVETITILQTIGTPVVRAAR